MAPTVRLLRRGASQPRGKRARYTVACSALAGSFQPVELRLALGWIKIIVGVRDQTR